MFFENGCVRKGIRQVPEFLIPVVFNEPLFVLIENSGFCHAESKAFGNERVSDDRSERGEEQMPKVEADKAMKKQSFNTFQVL